MRLDVEGFYLTWTEMLDGAELAVRRDPRCLPPIGPTFRFMADRHHRRLEFAMTFPPTGRVIGVSTQPGILGTVLADAGRGEGAPVGVRHAVVARWVTELAARVGAWHPTSGEAALDTVVGGAAFPLLGAAYELGVAPLSHVPMWAAPVLRQPTARAGARAAFGVKATRPLVLALASSLSGTVSGEGNAGQPRPRANITALALSLMGSPALEPDPLARILRTPAPGAAPSGEQIAAGQKVVARLGRVRAERILTEAGRSERALGMLAQMVEMYAQVGHLLAERPAAGLEALRAQCLAMMPRDPNPERHAAPPPRQLSRSRRRVPAAAPALRGCETPTPPVGQRAHYQALAPPPTTSAVTTQALRFPLEIQALDQVDLGGLRLILPRTISELVTWGQLLGNCLGSFGAAAATGRSWLLGVEASDRLAYCLELAPDWSVRQFLAARNRPVPPGHAKRVLRYLAQCRIIAHASSTLPWDIT